MFRSIASALLFLCFSGPFLAQAAKPEVLECTVAFQLKESSSPAVVAQTNSQRNIRIIDSGRTENNRWIFLIRILGDSVSQFSSEMKFQTKEKYPAEFHLAATSGRHFGKVQLFNLEWGFADSGSWVFQTSKTEIVAQSSPLELNSYGSLKNEMAATVAEVTSTEINCGPVGWSFGGL